MYARAVCLISLWLCSASVNAIASCRPHGEELLAGTELLHAFVVFRHGERTPRREEAAKYPKGPKNLTYEPYGYEALTNEGKRREYQLGEQLRCRYDGFVDQVYSSEQISINTTDTERTKMSALVVAAAMFPPTNATAWRDGLHWTPLPYNVHPPEGKHAANCPKHIWLRKQLLQTPAMEARLATFQGWLRVLSTHSGANITTPLHVRHLRECILAQHNFGIPFPSWFLDLRKEIEEISLFDFELYHHNDNLTQLVGGVDLNSFLDVADAVVSGGVPRPRLQLLSAHEVTVAAVMTGSRVFQQHIPRYGSAFALELRRNTTTGQYGVAAVYLPQAGESSATVLPVRGCGGGPLCNYTTFLQLTSAVRTTRAQVVLDCKTG